jgi:hypothetical protein|tara:strand:+ start:6623 stop:6826 length:204 start_codon:yes stop_codon:yes gene_type:complete
MPLPIEEFIERLSQVSDPPLLCELLGLNSEDILERFSDVLEDRIEVLREIYDIDFEETMLYNREYDE